MAHQLFLNRRTDGEIRIGGSERNNIRGLLRPAHVEGALAQKVQANNVVRKRARRNVVGLSDWQQNGAADLRREEMPCKLASLGNIRSALPATPRRIGGKSLFQIGRRIPVANPKLFRQGYAVRDGRRYALAGERRKR